jgi:hypothetical protein
MFEFKKQEENANNNPFQEERNEEFKQEPNVVISELDSRMREFMSNTVEIQ